MNLLTGGYDPVKEPLADEVPSRWQSQYGGREEYDPQDREFNKQFDERPRGPQPWDSPGTTPRRGNLPDRRDPIVSIPTPPVRNPSTPVSGGGNIITPPTQDLSSFESRLATLEGRKPSWQEGRVSALEQRPWWQEDRIKALEDRPQSTGGGWQEDRIKALENRPQGTGGGGWQEDRIAALEGRKPQDLSGITGRISKLEGRQPSWQEDRIKALEGRQDDTSWRDQLSQVQSTQAGYGTQLGNLQTQQTQGQTARSALDQRLGALEEYYRNDPPPEDSVGNRYEDKMANLNKLWERAGKAQAWGDDASKETGFKGKDHWDYSYAADQGQAWAKDLPLSLIHI